MKYKVSVLAYCLMTNHIHVVAVPAGEDSVSEGVPTPAYAVRPPHQSREEMEGASVAGQVLFLALDETYLWAAIRYVERNPVRARIVRRAENYKQE